MCLIHLQFINMKKNILTIFALLIGILSFSQTFEEYKKSQESKFKSFKEKRDQELKEFISNEENWNLITIDTKGNVKENIEQTSSPDEEKKEEQKTKVKQEEPNKNKNVPIPNYVNLKTQETSNKNIDYHHPLKNSKFRLSSPFGFRIHPIYKTKRFHSGLDYAANKGVPIFSIDNGNVIRAGVAKGYGNYIVIDHGSGLKSAYAHMSLMSVNKGDLIKKRDKIGEVGMSGAATGNHLHFEIIKNNKKVNPKTYI